MSMHKLEGTEHYEGLANVAKRQEWGFAPAAVAYVEKSHGYTDAMRDDAEAWCKKNCVGMTMIKGSIFYFEPTEDATHFWLAHSNPEDLK